MLGWCIYTFISCMKSLSAMALGFYMLLEDAILNYEVRLASLNFRLWMDSVQLLLCVYVSRCVWT